MRSLLKLHQQQPDSPPQPDSPQQPAAATMRGAAMAGLLAAHATAMNATNYTNTYARCVFQKVRRTSCAHKSRNSHHLFKGKPTASRVSPNAKAYRLCRLLRNASPRTLAPVAPAQHNLPAHDHEKPREHHTS